MQTICTRPRWRCRWQRTCVWGTTAPIAELYGTFVKAGGAVLLCAHCAHNAGVDAGNLRDGARIGTDAQVRELFIAAEKIVDY
jgi:hypothetical protein